MRTIRISHADDILASAPAGVTVSIPVKVDWPELQLTDEQMIANVVARMWREPEPYPDPSIFEIRLQRSLKGTDADES